MYYIYGLADPDTKVIRYVGQTNNLKSRLRGHICEAKNLLNIDRKSKWIRSINYNPEMITLNVLSTQLECNAAEIFHISQLKDCGFNLVNFLDGGVNPPNLKGELAVNAKLTEQDVVYIRKELNSGNKSLTELHKEYSNMTLQCIHLAATGNSWAHVKEPVFKPRKNVKLTNDDVVQIRNLLAEGRLNQPAIARMFNICQSTVSDIKRNKRRKNIQLTTSTVVS